jgi:DNA-binding transcriptional ArsR family regulator
VTELDMQGPPMDPSARAELDSFLVDPTRLAIMSLLATGLWRRFPVVRSSVGITSKGIVLAGKEIA